MPPLPTSSMSGSGTSEKHASDISASGPYTFTWHLLRTSFRTRTRFTHCERRFLPRWTELNARLERTGRQNGVKMRDQSSPQERCGQDNATAISRVRCCKASDQKLQSGAAFCKSNAAFNERRSPFNFDHDLLSGPALETILRLHHVSSRTAVKGFQNTVYKQPFRAHPVLFCGPSSYSVRHFASF